MKHKPLLVKGALGKDFIRSVHHVQGAAENCNIPHETLTVWQVSSTVPAYQAYICIAFVKSTIIIFLCNRPTLEAKTLNRVQPSSKLLSPCVPGCPVKTSPVHMALLTGSPTSHEKEGACLVMNSLHPFLGPHAASLHLPLPAERPEENKSLPQDGPLTLGWKTWFKSTAMQCKNSSSDSFTNRLQISDLDW